MDMKEIIFEARHLSAVKGWTRGTYGRYEDDSDADLISVADKNDTSVQSFCILGLLVRAAGDSYITNSPENRYPGTEWQSVLDRIWEEMVKIDPLELTDGERSLATVFRIAKWNDARERSKSQIMSVLDEVWKSM